MATPPAGSSNVQGADDGYTSTPAVTSYPVRIINNPNKTFSIMRTKLSSGHGLSNMTNPTLVRESLPISLENVMVEGGAAVEKYKQEDQPWLLEHGGKEDRRQLRGVRAGDLTEEACSYYMLTRATDGGFEAFQVQEWYDFKAIQTPKPLNYAAEEIIERERVSDIRLFNRLKGIEDYECDELAKISEGEKFSMVHVKREILAVLKANIPEPMPWLDMKKLLKEKFGRSLNKAMFNRALDDLKEKKKIESWKEGKKTYFASMDLDLHDGDKVDEMKRERTDDDQDEDEDQDDDDDQDDDEEDDDDDQDDDEGPDIYDQYEDDQDDNGDGGSSASEMDEAKPNYKSKPATSSVKRKEDDAVTTSDAAAGDSSGQEAKKPRLYLGAGPSASDPEKDQSGEADE